jgi:2-methoxy-6-polyprenyl-1,4-benzoquinol methylase
MSRLLTAARCCARAASAAPAARGAPARAFSAGAPPPPPGAPLQTHFGFETVDAAGKAARVADVFRRVAEKYDVMNDLMSAGVHRLWKDEFVRMAGRVTAPAGAGATCLDVAGGTGDVAFRIADSMARSFVRPAAAPRIIVSDINAAMLDVGRARAAARGLEAAAAADALAPRLEWRVGDAEALDWVPDNSVDLYTIAFGIRNCTHVDRVLREAHRVLRPGGRFMCLEFSHVTLPGLREAYEAYSFAVIPAMGAAVAGDRASYQYLVESIRNFPTQERFADMIADAGFAGVDYTNFTFGVAAVHSGYKLAPRGA